MKIRGNYLWISLPVLLLAAGSVLAKPPIPVTECETIITEPGKYFLVNDLVGCESVGVEIESSDVTLDLKGHAISCAFNDLRSGGVVTVGVPGAPVRNIKVTNGMVSNCSDGIVLILTEDSKVTKITSTENRLWQDRSGTGITLWQSHNNVIMHNQTYYNVDAGIASWESSGNLFKHNTSTDNLWGIWMQDDSDSRILCNRTWSNAVGIALTPGSNGILVRGNIASYNWFDGISIAGFAWGGVPWLDVPHGNTVRSNIAESNDSNDLFVGYWEVATGDDIYPGPDTCLNTWEQNQYGMALGPTGCIAAPVVLDEDDVCALDDFD